MELSGSIFPSYDHTSQHTSPHPGMSDGQGDMPESWNRGMATLQVQILVDTMQVKPEVQMYSLSAVQNPRNL